MRRLVWLLPLLLVSCDDFERNAYRSLIVAQSSYETLTNDVYAKYSSGQLTPEQYEQAAALFERWGKAHNEAVTALEIYHLSKDYASRDKVLTALIFADTILSELRALLTGFGVMDEGRLQ